MQRLTKFFTAAIAGLALSIAPAHARVEDDTKELLELLHSTGVTVTINHPQICKGDIHGNYQFVGMKRQMNLCPGNSVDAMDHLTVRHETWHAIQHCVNAARGTAPNTPVQQDINELAGVVNQVLSSDRVEWIKSAYPQAHWLVEFEANVAADVFTATELIKVYTDTCLAR